VLWKWNVEPIIFFKAPVTMAIMGSPYFKWCKAWCFHVNQACWTISLMLPFDRNKHKMNVHDCSSWHPHKNIQKMFLWSTMACICIFVCFQFEGIIVCRLGLLTFGYGFEPHQWQLKHLTSPKIRWILQLHVIANHPSTHLI
jgi:hypothetical protein